MLNSFCYGRQIDKFGKASDAFKKFRCMNEKMCSKFTRTFMPWFNINSVERYTNFVHLMSKVHYKRTKVKTYGTWLNNTSFSSFFDCKNSRVSEMMNKWLTKSKKNDYIFANFQSIFKKSNDFIKEFRIVIK